VRSTNYEAPHYTLFSILLSLPPPWGQAFPSHPFLIHPFPLMWDANRIQSSEKRETKIHARTKSQEIYKNEFLTLYPAKCRDRDATPNLKTHNTIMCCLIRAITNLRERWRWVWDNGGMIISGESWINLEITALQCHFLVPVNCVGIMSTWLLKSMS
jgi:hypothetical protein